MAINFPNAPTIGQKYTAEGQTWVWNGTMWLIDSAAAGSAVIASPTPPADPLAGQLWYRTTNPVGMFMWLNDGNSTQWVQTNGGGNTAPPLVASTAEARAGTDNVKMMTPAAVQARTGFTAEIGAAGLTTVSLGAIPAEAKEITISLNDFTYPANSGVALSFITAGTAIWYATRTRVDNGVVPAVMDASGSLSSVLDNYTGQIALFGAYTLKCAGGTHWWNITGSARRATTSQIIWAGSVISITPAELASGLKLTSTGAAFLNGFAQLRWRI